MKTDFAGFKKIISQKLAGIESTSKICQSVELAFPEIETEFLWQRVEGVNGQNYKNHWVEEHSKRVNTCLEIYSLPGGRQLEIRLDPKAAMISRRANKLVRRLFSSDSNALRST